MVHTDNLVRLKFCKLEAQDGYSRLDAPNFRRKSPRSGEVLHTMEGLFSFWHGGAFRKCELTTIQDGDFIVIQAEPWWRPDFVPNATNPASTWRSREEMRALWHLQEVIQTMLDSIIFDGRNNWAHLVRLKNGTYRLVYMQRQLIHDCPIWTKVVELDDIEMTRFVGADCWEGIYQGEEVDIFFGWRDDWAGCIALESRGQKLVKSRGVGHYFFELKAHIYKNGALIGVMMEAFVGRGVSLSDRPAVLEALADIQQRGIFVSFNLGDIYITERGVRFAGASTARYYSDRDALAKDASITWDALAKAFNNLNGILSGCFLRGTRSLCSKAVIIPRLPSPSRPITLTPEEALIRWFWSMSKSEESLRSCGTSSFKLHKFAYGRSDDSDHPSGKRMKGGARLSPDEFSNDLKKAFVPIDKSSDGPLVVRHRALVRYRPYMHPSRPLLLPPEPDTAELTV